MQDHEESFKNLRILITGGLGFIGSNLTHKLVRLGSRVTIVDSLIPECGGSIHNIRGIENDVLLNNADVRDVHKMNDLVKDQDLIFI